MPGRQRHQRKEVEKALRFAEAAGCTIEVVHAGHTWGYVVTPDRAKQVIFSTPRDQDVAARIIGRFVRNHPAVEPAGVDSDDEPEEKPDDGV